LKFKIENSKYEQRLQMTLKDLFASNFEFPESSKFINRVFRRDWRSLQN